MKRSFFFYCLLACLLTAGSRAMAQEDEPLTFGVISDIHFGNGAGEGPLVKVPRALRNLTSQGRLDVLAVVGDLANSGAAEEYEQLVSVFKDEANFANPVGKLLFMMGNHDHFNSDGRAHYQQGLGAFSADGGDYPFHTYTVVKGYPFITISMMSGDSNDTSSAAAGTAAYSADVVAQLEEWLARAASECPGKPIFVFTHVPPRWTVYGSWPEVETGGAWGMQVLNPVLNKYPQAVVFAGHSHYPLGDPRSIHQGVNPESPRQNYYTVINTASTTYSEINPGAVDAGIHPAGYDNVTEGMVLTELPNGDIEIRRFDTTRDVEIGAADRWVLKAPFDGSMFQYGDKRDADDNPDGRPLRNGGNAPAFTTSAELTVEASPFSAELIIPQATDDECVFRYRVRVSRGGLVVMERFLFSQFYLNTDMPKTLNLSLKPLEDKTKYTVEVVAMDSYDNMSAPLTATFTTPSGSGISDAAPDAHWTFSDPDDLLKVEKGNFLLQPISVGNKSVKVVNSLDEVGITSTKDEIGEDGAVFIPKEAGFKLVRPDGSQTTKDYTIMLYMKVKDAYPYNALFQTNAGNTNDGDLFISKHQVGINVNGLGYHGEIEDDTWHRFFILNRDGDFCVYVDGHLVSHTSSQGCWEIDPWGCYLFCDEDGEMNDTYLSEAAFWEYGITTAQVEDLSGIEPEDPNVPFLTVVTSSVKVVDNLDFTVTVSTNVPFTFTLPDWIEAIDTVPFAGERAYAFRAKPMAKPGKRTGYIIIEAVGVDPSEGLEPCEVEVEQTYVGDEVPEPIGRWTFNDPFDLMHGVGESAICAAFKGELGPETTDDPASAGIVPIAGPTEENGAIRVPADAYLWLSANTDAETLSSFTLMFDIRPADTKGYKALFQNDITNHEDAGLFFKNNQVGRGGASDNLGYVGNFDPERWYRLLFVVQDSYARLYVDGEKISESPASHNYWNLLGDALLFADNDGEEGTVELAELRLWDYPLSDKLARKLSDVYSDIERLFVVQTTPIRLVDETDFSITVNANVPVTFTLPDWVEAVDIEPFVGEKAYTFRALPMEEEGRRSDIIVVEADFFDMQEIEITQIKLGDSMPEAWGRWTFDDPSALLKGEGEAALRAATLADGIIQPADDPAAAGLKAIEGPLAGNGAISVPADACLWLTSNLGIDQLRDFSILYDIRPSALNGWNGLYLNDVNNKSDAALFIKNGLVGSGQSGLSYHGDVVAGKWHRILFVVRGGYATVYLDGEKMGQSTSAYAGWTLLPDVLLLMDNDGETKDNDVAEIRFWDVPLNDAQALELGGVEQNWEDEPFVDPVSIWTFDNPADPLAGTGTATLRGAVKGSSGPELVTDLTAAGFKAISGTSEGDGALTVPVDCYLQFARSGGGDLNTFSFLMDIRPKSLNGFNAIFQSHVNNDDDGSLYTSGKMIGINISGLGYGGSLVEGQWHRIVFVVNENCMSVFIDGTKVLATFTPNADKWILHDVAWLFCDDNGEEGTVDVAELRYWDVALTSAQIKSLAGAGFDTSVAPPLTDDVHKASPAWYDLSGRRLSTTPTAKGLYIVDGNKVLIR